jgi:hypothetical protein
MPRPVRASLWLLIGGYLVGLAIASFDAGQWARTPDRQTLITAIIVGIAIVWLIVFVALRTYQGRNWARWVQLITQVAAFPSFIREIGALFGIAPVVSSVYALLFATQAVSVALLFTPTASLWYRQLSADQSHIRAH